MRALYIVVAVSLFHPGNAAADTDYHILFYGGRMSQDRLVGDILLAWEPTYEDSWLMTVAPGMTLGSGPVGDLVWEVEGQLVKHFGDQTHLETNIALLARWTRFPWDHWVDTTVAFGEGLSLATTKPPLEMEDDDDETRALLNYLALELTFSPPGDSQWEVVTRIHHRSGVFGLFGVSGGSNALGWGTRWRF